MRKLLFLLITIVVFSVFAASGTTTNRTVTTPVPAPTPALGPPCTATMSNSISACPNTGCGDFADALLNQMKNRRITSGLPAPQVVTLNQIRELQEPSFSTGDPRSGLAATENRVVTVQAFLLKAKREGSESCNCGITGPFNTDIHLVLVDSLPDLDDQDEVDAAEQGSVTAEITPRVRRQGHANWVVKNINDFEGEFVRLTGMMMLDTKHIPQEHRLEGERKNKRLKRATNWEIHPVFRFQFCNSTVAKCRQGQGWVNF